jgi:hypothetical protein
LEGEKLYGPPLNNILDSTVNVIRNGTKKEIIIDRKYLLNSISNPNKEKLMGYENRVMPETNLSDEKIAYIVDYLISINEEK